MVTGGNGCELDASHKDRANPSPADATMAARRARFPGIGGIRTVVLDSDRLVLCKRILL